MWHLRNLIIKLSLHDIHACITRKTLNGLLELICNSWISSKILHFKIQWDNSEEFIIRSHIDVNHKQQKTSVHELLRWHIYIYDNKACGVFLLCAVNILHRNYTILHVFFYFDIITSTYTTKTLQASFPCSFITNLLTKMSSIHFNSFVHGLLLV